MSERQTLYMRVAFLIALISLIGSLYFSEIAGFPPCKLCWYQRIALYPITLILAIGLLRKDITAYLYALPLGIIGLGISVYHNLLYYKIIPDSLAPCELGVSCTTKYIEWFGFITIPLLSFLALAAITVLMIMIKKEKGN